MTSPSAERSSVRAVLRVREFRALLAATGLSMLGDQITRIAVAVLVFERTGSPFLAAATLACSFLTWIVGGPVLSALADRWPRRALMIWCDVLRAGLVLLLLIPSPPLWFVFAILILAGVLAPPFESAKSAALPDVLVGEAYGTGNALMSSLKQGAMVLGFLLGGALVAALSPRGALAVDAATFAASAVLIRLGVHDRPCSTPSGTHLLNETREGVSLVLRDDQLRRLLSYGVLGTICLVVPEGLAVPVSESVGGGPVTAGVLTASLPAGFVVGSILVMRLPVERREQLLPTLTALAAVPLLMTPLASSSLIVVPLWALSGVFSCAQVIANASYMLAAAPHARGRAYGVAATAIMVSQGVALLAAGAAAEIVGSRGTVAAAAGLTLILLIPLVTSAPPRREIRLDEEHGARCATGVTQR